MTIVADLGTSVETASERKPRSRMSALRRFARRNPLGAAGAIVVIVMMFMAVFADVIAPYDPLANAFDRLHEPPSWQTGSAPTSSAATCSRA